MRDISQIPTICKKRKKNLTMKKTEPLTPIFKIESTLLHPSPLKWGLALRGPLSASRRSPLDLLGLAPRRARAPFGPARLSLRPPRAPLLFPSPGPDESGDSSQKNTKTSKTHPRLRIRASLTRYESPEVESGSSHTELPLLGDGNRTQRGGLPRHIPGISAKCMGW